MKFVALLLLLCSVGDAEARGIYFQIYGDRAVVVEDARMQRCEPAITDAPSRAGKIASCRPVGDGWLVGVVDGTGVRLERLRKNGDIVWRRTLEGTVAFATETMLVFKTGKNYRAIWLSDASGKTIAEATFVPIAARKLPDWCGDEINGTFRSSESKPRLAAICTVYD